MATEDYDLIVIGAGAVGENVADRATRGGLRTVVIERDLVGGECSYWACMPSKALLRSPAALRAATAVGGAREAITGDLDVNALLDRRDTFTSHWKDQGQVDWLESAGIDLIRGRGSIHGARKVIVTTEDEGQFTLTATHAVALCTGSAPLIAPIPGIASMVPWTSRDLTTVRNIPESIIIVGGGVVACEMATVFAQLGSVVTVLSRSQLLDSEEPFAGELVAESLIGMGVDLRLKTHISKLSRAADGTVHAVLENGAQIFAEQIAVATGRKPRTDDVGLDAVGLVPGDWLHVDDTMLVRDPHTGSSEFDGESDWLYAIGDVNNRAPLTHQGKYQARAAGDVIVARAAGLAVTAEPWSQYAATADHQAVPQAIFTEPEVASVGLTAAAAKKAGYEIRVIDYEIGHVAGAALHADHYRGTARIVVDESRRVLLGATFVGPEVAELLHAATIAVVAEVPIERLWHAVPAYPTISEVWLRLLEAYGRPSDW